MGMKKEFFNWNREWLDEEDEYLEEHYSTSNKEKMMDDLGRSWESIKSHAFKLDLRRSRKGNDSC